MNEYILEDAIGYLDLDLIEWHITRKNELRKKKKRKNMIARLSVLAACVCLLIGVVILLPYINLGENQVQYYKFLGDTQKNDFAEITFTDLDRENHICYFTLIKKDYTRFYFVFEGFTNRGELIQYDIVTPYPLYIPEWGHRVMDVELIITVNGEVVNSIPRKPGEYEISIDFSEMYKYLDKVHSNVRVSHFQQFDFRTFESVHPGVTRPTGE